MKSFVGGAAALVIAAMPLTAHAEGNLAAPPAVDIELKIGGTAPTLEPTQFELVTGDYYRLTLTSDGAEEFMFRADEFLSNVHVRLLVIAGIEVHMQSMIFRGIEFDAGGSASFTFVPIRPGEYEFTVGEQAGKFIVR
jgi:hypothetical protein